MIIGWVDENLQRWTAFRRTRTLSERGLTSMSQMVSTVPELIFPHVVDVQHDSQVSEGVRESDHPAVTSGRFLEGMCSLPNLLAP